MPNETNLPFKPGTTPFYPIAPPSGPGNVGYIGHPTVGGTTDTGYGGQKTLGDIYRENALRQQQLAEEKLMWQQMLNQFSGPENTWIRLLIRDRMQYPGTSESDYKQASKGVPAPPVPDWMQEFVIPQTAQPEMPGYNVPRMFGGGGRRKTPREAKTSYTLRPLSAQEKLNPEQQSYMAGWLAYQQAGAPTKYSEEAFAGMSDIERWWSPYATQSQTMMPNQTKLRPRWATATQR